MVVVLDRGVTETQKRSVREHLEAHRYRIRELLQDGETVIGAVGGDPIDQREVALLPGVSQVVPLRQPYKLASREFKRADTEIGIGPVKVGGGRLAVFAGPSAVESRQQIFEVAALLKESGAVGLRGGAFKPRTSPYSFQGLGQPGVELLKEAGDRYGLPIVSEVVATEYLPLLADCVDVLQIGARNMQNFELLKRVGEIGKPVLLKRGLAATIEDLLLSAEYLLAHGTDAVILCERGIRTFETYTRSTLDLSAIPVVKKLSHLPILVDPSHGTGRRDHVQPMALAGVAAGADGILVEVHPDPETARSDGPQSLYPGQFEKLMRDIERLAPVLGKEVLRLPHSDRPRRRTAAAADAETVSVAFQGERGAHSENAIYQYFANPRPVPGREFQDVFRMVLDGSVEYGVLPVENSLTGSIHQNYDLLMQYPDVRIVGEITIRIRWCLIAPPGAATARIRRVLSHPQGLAQCARFLAGFPDWEEVPFYDTAGAVAEVARAGAVNQAALAGAAAAREHGMSVLAEGIETNIRNYTRFVVLAREEHAAVADPTRASIVFSTRDEPGSLFQVLQVLADRHLNMKKLESRPIPGRPWEYMFYVDLDLPPRRGQFEQAMEQVRAAAASYRLLGMYRSGRTTTPAGDR
jgi:3-deoxy-7-phosphoheptulonate synthase